MRLKNIAVLFLLLICFTGKSQQRRFEHLTSADGLSQSEVYAFLKDSRGFMWMGTVDGLNVYDGYTIEIFNTSINDSNSLSNNTIRSLAEDQLGRIWIGTDDGLNVYDPKTELIYQIKNNSQNEKFPVWSLLIQNGHLLMGAANELWRADVRSASIKTIASEFYKIEHFNNQTGQGNMIRSIANCKSGGSWIVTQNNLYRIVFQGNTFEPIILEDLSFSYFSYQSAATEDSAGNLWITSREHGLLRYNPAIRKADHFDENGTAYGPSSGKCSSLAIDKSGNLWIGTFDMGLNFVKAGELNKDTLNFESIQFETFNTSSLNSNLIRSLYVSNDNLLWAGTIGAGVNIFNPEQKKFSHFTFKNPDDELSSLNFVRSVYADSEGRIWTGTHGNGLFLYNREKKLFQKAGFGTESIFFISNYQDGKKFICSSSGLYLVELINEQLKILSQYKDNAVFYIVKSKADVFWIASINGLKRIKIVSDQINEESIYTSDSSPGISVNNCRVLFYDSKDSTLYLGTEGGGLNVISLNNDHYPEKIQIYKKSNDSNTISNNYIRSIIKDKNRQIWVGTFTGLNKLIKDTASGKILFKRYTMKDGLPNNMIQSIAHDNKNNLWIGTNGGLAQFNPEEEKFINYTLQDGIQSNEFSEHAVFKKQDGEIIMGGINGINAFYPEEIKISPLKPKTTITAFYLNNKKVSPYEKIGRKAPLKKTISLTDTIQLLPKQNNIGFEFSAMIYPNSEKIRYAYMLEGFDNNWYYTDAGNRMVSYTNLRHGEYIFKVKATNSDGIWEDSPAEIFVRIQTPFLYSWVAVAMYLVVIVLIIIYFSHFTIIRYTTKKKLLLEKVHNEKLHELDVLRTKFFINISHDLRTPLALIQGPLDSVLKNNRLAQDVNEKMQLIKRNVKRLNYLVEQLLDVRKSESGKLSAKPDKADIVSFTKEEAAHFSFALKQKGLTLNITSYSDSISACFDKAMIAKVYFNIISNAIKFTDKGKIEITIEKTDRDEYEILMNAPFSSFVKVEVKDSGRGIPREQYEKIFDRFYQGKTQSGSGYGIGLSHTKELIDAHEGYIEAESTEGIGTLVRFFLPDIEIPAEEEQINTGSTEDMHIELNANAGEVCGGEQVRETAQTLLIVEDNADMRRYIKIELQTEYNIIEAGDGLEGWKQAKKFMPDLIVCDVMMPNMDGIELCEKIKTTLETSHIPFILLTAKVDLETKYDGIKTGADDYIPKPFEMEYLSIRIKNLLESREKLRKKFQTISALEPSDVTVTSVDEEFLSTLIQDLEAAIPDPDFLISSLESKMGMSHAKFYRKIKSLTGQSGKEILLNMRMKRAHQILSQKKGMQVAEVAYMVGFSNPKYFSRYFSEKYGFAPSDLIR